MEAGDGGAVSVGVEVSVAEGRGGGGRGDEGGDRSTRRKGGRPSCARYME